jgi:periplasmic copper chaperone A
VSFKVNVFWGLALLGVVTACGGPSTDSGETSAASPESAASVEPAAPAASATSGDSSLEVREARALLMPGMGAVYLTVVNSGSQGDRLLRVATTLARDAELHETREEKGVMRMVPSPEGFEVAAGGTLKLEPGGKHVMLVDPMVPTDSKGATIPLTVHFERAGAIEVQAAITEPQ